MLVCLIDIRDLSSLSRFSIIDWPHYQEGSNMAQIVVAILLRLIYTMAKSPVAFGSKEVKANVTHNKELGGASNTAQQGEKGKLNNIAIQPQLINTDTMLLE
jgi:hypothetical protein